MFFSEFKEENKALVTVYEGKSQEENKTPMQLLLEHMSNCFKCFEVFFFCCIII
jgi:hypothetical protein